MPDRHDLFTRTLREYPLTALYFALSLWITLIIKVLEALP